MNTVDNAEETEIRHQSAAVFRPDALAFNQFE
jgi:hypothetical protein